MFINFKDSLDRWLEIAVKVLFNSILPVVFAVGSLYLYDRDPTRATYFLLWGILLIVLGRN